MPSDCELDLKALAKTTEDKKIETVALKDVEQNTTCPLMNSEKSGSSHRETGVDGCDLGSRVSCSYVAERLEESDPSRLGPPRSLRPEYSLRPTKRNQPAASVARLLSTNITYRLIVTILPEVQPRPEDPTASGTTCTKVKGQFDIFRLVGYPSVSSSTSTSGCVSVEGVTTPSRLPGAALVFRQLPSKLRIPVGVSSGDGVAERSKQSKEVRS